MYILGDETLKGMLQYVRTKLRNCYWKWKLNCILALGPIGDKMKGFNEIGGKYEIF